LGNNVHFEVFRRHGKSGWTLQEAASDREAALKLAQNLMAEGGATGVKVIKETYNDESGEFLTLKIFEDGHNKMKLDAQAEDVPNALPCFKPDDFYSYHARATMARLLGDFLARNRITVSELIHRADMLEKFEATGTAYQHAVQKIAVAQAASTSVSVQQIIRSLNDLLTRAIQRVYRDDKRGAFALPAGMTIGQLADKHVKEPDGAYLLNGAIAGLLCDKGWDEKLGLLLALLDDTAEDRPGRELLLSSVDTIVAEILRGRAALANLIPQNGNFGDSLFALVELFLANSDAIAGASPSVAVLARHFARDELESSRGALAKRIVAEIKSNKRLDPQSLENEVRLLRRVANRIVLGINKHLSHEDVIASFTLRSKRLVALDALSEILNDTCTVDVKIERLLLVEENIIGVENKRRIADFLGTLLLSNTFEGRFLDPNVPALQRLKRLVELQTAMSRAGIPDAQKKAFCESIDRIGCQVEGQAKLIESVTLRAKNPVDRALTLLRLCTGGVLTEGRLSQRARDTVVSCLSQPGFLAAYTAQTTQTGQEQGVAALADMLTKAGIPKEALKALAA
jgi:hypothetical protein